LSASFIIKTAKLLIIAFTRTSRTTEFHYLPGEGGIIASIFILLSHLTTFSMLSPFASRLFDYLLKFGTTIGLSLSIKTIICLFFNSLADIFSSSSSSEYFDKEYSEELEDFSRSPSFLSI